LKKIKSLQKNIFMNQIKIKIIRKINNKLVIFLIHDLDYMLRSNEEVFHFQIYIK